MPNPELVKYIASARQQNISDDSIKNELIKQSWPQQDVLEALSPSSAPVPTIPAPPVPHFGMWVAFQYIILFITLYISASCFAGILHFAADKHISDTLDNINFSKSEFASTILMGYIAGIVVSYPIFAFLFIRLKQQTIQKPGVRNFRTRKLLMYITLVGTFLLMMGNLIMIIYSFLMGTATTRAFAHFVITVLVAGSIFGYLLHEVREDRKLE